MRGCEEGAATRATRSARRPTRRAAAAGARLLTSEGERPPAPGACPDIRWALAAAVFMHRGFAVESRGDEVREVGWVQSSAMLVRREAARQVGWLDPDFFVYSDETDFCKRLDEAGWRILFAPRRGHPSRPAPRPTPRRSAPHRRVPPQPRPATSVSMACRSRGSLWKLAGLGLPARAPRRRPSCRATPRAATCCTRARSWRPARGEGIREAAALYNAGRSDSHPSTLSRPDGTP